MKTIDQSRDAATTAANAAVDVIREKAEALRTFVGDEGSRVREIAIEKAGEARQYLSRRGPAGVGKDLIQVAKDHPVAATATVLGLAYLASRLLRD